MKRIIMMVFAVASLILNIVMSAALISVHQNHAEDEIASVNYIEGNFRWLFDDSYSNTKYNQALCYDVIPDQETAVRVAQAVYDEMKGVRSGFVPSSVMYDPEKEVWFVNFGVSYSLSFLN